LYLNCEFKTPGREGGDREKRVKACSVLYETDEHESGNVLLQYVGCCTVGITAVQNLNVW